MDTPNDNERKIVEEYLNFFCIEECLDEALNNIAIARPKNPYLAIASFMETKTTHEILDITLSAYVCNMRCGVKATVISNLGSFTAYSANETNVQLFKDFSSVQEKIKSILVGCDPTNLSLIDEHLSTIVDLDRAESFVISAACCRAAARHRGIQPYEIIAAATGLNLEDVVIPVPVVPIVSRMIFAGSRTLTQDVTATVLNAATFGNAMEMIMTVSANVAKLDSFKVSNKVSLSGCPCVDSSTINVIMKVVRAFVVESSLADNVGVGVNFRGSHLIKQTALTAPTAAVVTDAGVLYTLDTSTPLIAKNGNEVVEALLGLWQETEFISLEKPVAEVDLGALRQLRKRVKETVFDNKSVGSDKLKYCLSGVGGDADCSLQMILDEQSFSKITDFESFAAEMPFNSVKLQLSNFRTISSAIEVCKKIKKLKYSLIVCGCDSIAETDESSAVTALHDPILADFALGVGAGQFYGGGLQSVEYSEPYNRFLEISQNNPLLRYAGANFRISRR